MIAAFAGVQAALFVAVLVGMGVRGRAVLFRHSLDAAAFRRAAVERVKAGELASAARLAEASRETWLGRVLGAALDARSVGEPPEGPLAEALTEIRHDAFRGFVWFRGAARLGPLLGLGAAAATLAVGHGAPAGPDPGIFGRGLTHMIVGVVTAFVAADAARTIGLVALDQVREATRLARALDGILGEAAEG
ncbi:MAG TPA: hypothetical protein RMF84_15830, partial [Polyangiaceae bacterium LLY-WYZ-14_1]|nr:hypothetical protein [Polyangiaceae bacterium LLY-WYZ-14_1]